MTDMEKLLHDLNIHIRAYRDGKKVVQGCEVTGISTVDVLERAADVVCDKVLGEDDERVVDGEWIEDDYGFFHCSRCGFEWDESEYTSNYCPECGAKNGRVVMVDEEDEE